MKIITFSLLLLISNYSFSQLETPSTTIKKHINSFGISFELGGGLEMADDIETVVSSDYHRSIVEGVGKPNVGCGLFWEHQWNFHKNHGLLFGMAVNYTSFYSGVTFKNPEYAGTQYIAPTKEYVLGDFRQSFVSLELPLSYTYAIKTKIGTFNPFLGVTLKTIAYVQDAGRNYGGVSSTTSEINGNDTIYYNQHYFRYGTKSISPVLMPTIGLKYSTDLKNGGKMNFFLNYKFFIKTSNTVEAYLNDYDNTENGIEYLYFSSDHPISYNQSTGEWSGTKQSIYLRVNLSSFNVGLSYTFK